MALINCPECNKEISDKAPACPGCGSPIAVAGPIQAAAKETEDSGAPQVQTIQETSKQLKSQMVMSLLVFGAGVVFWISVEKTPGGNEGTLPMIVTAAGIVWYLATRYRIWWHHK